VANIILFEHRPELAIAIGSYIAPDGHTVVEHADNLIDAFSVLTKLALKEKQGDVILLDGSLRRIGQKAILQVPNGEHIAFTPDSTHAGDARAILKAMGHLDLEIPVIGLSTVALIDHIRDPEDKGRITRDVTKFNIALLGSVITDVTTKNGSK
jgi:hypothetical protein